MESPRAVQQHEMQSIFQAGGILSFTLDAVGRGFAICATTRKTGSIVLYTKDGRLRDFIDPRAALQMLREIGANEARIKFGSWQPEQKVVRETTA